MYEKDKINAYYYNLKNKDEFKYFLFKKFYISPKKVLTKTENDVKNNDFYDENILKNYRNTEFMDLLSIVLYDNDFLCKLNYYNLKSLEIFVDDYNKKCNNKYADVMRLIGINARIKYNSEIKIYDLKEKVLNEIKENKDNQSVTLYLNYYNSDKVVDSLICDNKFLDLLESDILNRDLNEFTITNIIEMLLLSIRIKTNSPETLDEIYIRKRLMKREYYYEFDIQKAKELVFKLENKLKEIKHNRKIIYLS